MKLFETILCPQCDELFTKDNERCPSCMNSNLMELKKYIKPLSSITPNRKTVSNIRIITNN